METKNNYPFVLVSGLFSYGEEEFLSRIFPYFGLWKTDVRKLYNEQGIKCYTPSTGPFSSAWDKACELYAAIVGGTVDYGLAHSKEHGHARYGRTYRQALIPEWGQLDNEGKTHKINLIAYSLGGQSARALIELLANGSKAEREVTPEYSLSELFRGGHRDWIHSATFLSGAHEGTTAVYALKKLKILKPLLHLAGIGSSILGHTALSGIFDPRLDHFSISVEPGTAFFPRINRRRAKEFANGKDNIVYDNFPHVAYENNIKFLNETYDNIYYFSYSADCSIEHKKRYKVKRGTARKFLPMSITTWVLGRFTHTENNEESFIYDRAWQQNDGGVNVISNLAPFDQPQEFLSEETNIRPGVWYKIVEPGKTHMSYSGLGEKDEAHKQFYNDIAERVSSLESIEYTKRMIHN